MSEINTSPKLYIEEAFLKGFKSIDDLHIKLNRGLNIIIGQNGAGKSNFLEFLNNAVYSIYRVSGLTFKSAKLVYKSTNQDEIVYLIERKTYTKSQLLADEELLNEPYHQSLKINDELAYDDKNEEGLLTFKYQNKTLRSSRSIRMIFGRIGQRFVLPNYIRYTLPKNLAGIETPLTINIPLGDLDFYFEYETSSKLIHDILTELEKAINLEYNDIIDSADIENYEEPFLETLEKININYILEKIFVDENIISNLAQFSPIKNLRVNENINIFRDDKNFIIENIKLDFYVNSHWLPWSQLSDGTKRLFFIISEISSKSDGIVLIEEPELGVHPHQFDLIMQFLEEQSATKQIIMSTHSPKALDILDKRNLDKIFIAKYEKEKGTTIANLSQQQKGKADTYMSEVGFLSDYWLLSDLEE